MKLTLAVLCGLILLAGVFAIGHWEGKRAADKWYAAHAVFVDTAKPIELKDYDSVMIGWDIQGSCLDFNQKIRTLVMFSDFHDSDKPCKFTQKQFQPPTKGSEKEH